MITKTFLETGHLMYIMTNIYSGKVRGVCLHNMKLGKGIESHRETLVLWDSDRKLLFKAYSKFTTTPASWRTENSESHGSHHRQTCVIVEEMCRTICVGISNTYMIPTTKQTLLKFLTCLLSFHSRQDPNFSQGRKLLSQFSTGEEMEAQRD